MDKMNRDRKVYYIVFFCVIVSIIFQLVGSVTDGWYVVKFQSGDTEKLGLWYGTVCGSKVSGGCIKNDIADSPNPLSKYQVLTVIALAAALMAAGVLIVQILSSPTNPQPKCCSAGTGAFMCLVSGSFALGAAGRFAKVTVDLSLLFGNDVIKTPYSLIFTVIGGIIACVCFLALLIYLRYNSVTSQPNAQTTYLSDPNNVSQPPATSDHIFVDQQLQNHHLYQQSIPNVYYGPNISPASVSSATHKVVHITNVYNAPRVTTATRPANSLQRVSASPWAGNHAELLLHPVENRTAPPASHARYMKVHKPRVKKQRTSSHVLSVKKRDFSL